MPGKEPLSHESVFHLEFIIMFLLYHRSVGLNALADEDFMLVFFTPFYQDCQGFLLKGRKSERVVLAIVVVVVFLTFVVPFPLNV